ncbi:glucuronate isomerase [Portibacter marinus]|uniref:glucuronate isomerase n=1 Tax=Portibacter marinus TaxID=2898660 RepID=UPI001F2C815F|nr:glucuronate isomerase [Portibacter marinus]
MIQKIKPFLDDDFILENEVAKDLFHNYAKDLPIIDYHNHLPPKEIAEDRHFDNITQVWLYGDHYKWRAMRALGIEEYYITGAATDKEKFLQWAETVPYTMRNPLFHWTHMELKNYFGIDQILNKESAEYIYDSCNEKLKTAEFSAKGLLKQMNVEVVCTTDDPADELNFHQSFSEQDNHFKMLPTFRPDKAIMISKEGYRSYIESLSITAGQKIENYSELLVALKQRINDFETLGCKLSDHGLSKIFSIRTNEKELDDIFCKRLAGYSISDEESQTFMSGLMHELGKLYSEKQWTMQLHLGALRNNNDRMLRELGPDTGFDSIGDFTLAQDLSDYLNALDNEKALPKTIIYNLNPRDNEMIATMTGNFNTGAIKGKVQYGAAWWFLDQKDGMEKQLNALSNMGLLSCFIGMLTDSRSFLSFPRHEYFRRILCNLIGRDVHNGELPNDMDWLGSIVKDICYRNAKAYFNF